MNSPQTNIFLNGGASRKQIYSRATLKWLHLLTLAVLLSLSGTAHGFGNALDAWISQNSGTSIPLSDVAYGNGAWVVVGGYLDSPPAILVSTNGTSWEDRSSSVTVAPYKIIFTNGVFIGGGKAGKILTSTNGRDWSEHLTGFESGIISITYFQNQYVVLAQRTGIAVSPDGTNWTITRNDIGDFRANSIRANNEHVLFTSDYGEIGQSTNGTNWQVSYGPALRNIVFYDGSWLGQSVSWDSYSQIFRSADLTQWDFVTDSVRLLSSITLYNNVILGTSYDGKILSSHDGTNWTVHPTPVISQLLGIAYGNEKFVAVGNGGTVLTTKLDSLMLRIGDTPQTGVRIEVTSLPGSNFTIEASTNLINWLPVFKMTNSSGISEFRESETSRAFNFYRSVQ